MGLFDKVLGGKDSEAIKLSKQEGFAAIAVACIAADGDVAPEEVRRTVASLATMPMFRDYDMRDLAGTLNKVAGLIKRRGPASVVQAAKGVLSTEQAVAAFFVAADLVLADGTVEPEERQFLDDLQKTLGVESTLALKIVEVISIKNHP